MLVKVSSGETIARHAISPREDFDTETSLGVQLGL